MVRRVAFGLALSFGAWAQAPAVVSNPGELGDRTGRLKPGDAAADFELKTMHGEARVRLGAFRGRVPVALIFGSYT